MTQEQRERFIRSFFDTMRDRVLERANDMPDDWRGHEIRWYIDWLIGWRFLRGMRKQGGWRRRRWFKVMRERPELRPLV